MEDSIRFDTIKCSGNESRLQDCEHRGIRVHSCDKTRSAGVSCLPCMLIALHSNCLHIMNMCIFTQYGIYMYASMVVGYSTDDNPPAVCNTENSSLSEITKEDIERYTRGSINTHSMQ